MFVPAEVGSTDEPGTVQLILKGRAALADLGHDPDDWVDAETDAEHRAARSADTVQLQLWALGALVNYCGITGRRHDPPTSATTRQWIKDHWHMTRESDAGGRVKRGRLQQPYSPSTVSTRVYLIAGICNRLGWQSPTRDPRVHEQLDAYRIKFEDAGFKTFEADPMTPEMSVRLARAACDLGTVNGLRNALAFRLQFDTGCRATELVEGLRIDQVMWLAEDRVQLEFVQTKGRKPRKVYVQGLPTIPDPKDPTGRRQVRNPDWDVDPVRLLGLWLDLLGRMQITSGPLFREVSHAGQRRKDFAESGIYAGKVLREAWRRGEYQQCWDRAVRKSGIDVGPRGTRLRLTTHSNRAGLITAAFDAGMPLEAVAFRTGHNPGSDAIRRYLRSDRRWDDANPGVLVRKVKTAGDAERAAESRGRRGPQGKASDV